MNFLRGKGGNAGLIKKCGALDWLTIFSFIGLCSLVTYIGLRIAKSEEDLKKKCNRGMCSSDVEFTGPSLVRLIGFSFVGGFVSGALGLGGGSIFNPLLLSMGVKPQVSSSTGMYMVGYSTASSSIVYFYYGMLNIDYGLYIAAYCLVGTILGLILLERVMKKLNRQSPIVMLLSFMLGISAMIIPIFAGIDLSEDIKNHDTDILKFNSFC